MGFTVHFKTNLSTPNTLFKNLNPGRDAVGELREGCSITGPVILFQGNLSDFLQFNYAYIPKFHRYYYVTEIVSERSNLIRISFSVDVLMSFAKPSAINPKGIRDLKGILKRSESDYNPYLSDPSLVEQANPEITVRTFSNQTIFDTETLILVAGGYKDSTPD